MRSAGNGTAWLMSFGKSTNARRRDEGKENAHSFSRFNLISEYPVGNFIHGYEALARLFLRVIPVQDWVDENAKQKTLRKIDDGPNPLGSLQKEGLFIESKMRKHSDHKNESDEANNMSWLTMLKCGKDIALLVALLRKWQKRTRRPSECQSREKRGKARPRRCTVRSYEGTHEGHEFD